MFNFVDLCSGVDIVWLNTTRTRVSDATIVTFSVKCFNLLKLYILCQKTSSESGLLPSYYLNTDIQRYCIVFFCNTQGPTARGTHVMGGRPHLSAWVTTHLSTPEG